MARLILTFVLLMPAVIFSSQNAAPVALSFLSWRFESSIASVIVFSVLIGMLNGGIIVGLGRMQRSTGKASGKNKESA